MPESAHDKLVLKFPTGNSVTIPSPPAYIGFYLTTMFEELAAFEQDKAKRLDKARAALADAPDDDNEAQTAQVAAIDAETYQNDGSDTLAQLREDFGIGDISRVSVFLRLMLGDEFGTVLRSINSDELDVVQKVASAYAIDGYDTAMTAFYRYTGQPDPTDAAEAARKAPQDHKPKSTSKRAATSQ